MNSHLSINTQKIISFNALDRLDRSLLQNLHPLFLKLCLQLLEVHQLGVLVLQCPLDAFAFLAAAFRVFSCSLRLSEQLHESFSTKQTFTIT